MIVCKQADQSIQFIWNREFDGEKMKQIFVHGLGQMPTSWDKTIKIMDVSENAVCPNLPKLVQGCGMNYANLYNAFSEFCNKYEETVDICGLSLGGVLAINYAIDHPNKVRSLVLIAAQYKMPKRILQFQNVIFRFMPQSMFQQMGFGKTEFLQLCRTMMELDFSPSIKKIVCPTLIICGEKDSANKKASIELAGKMQNKKLCILNEAKHEINTEMPEKLAEVLQEFYSQIR